MTKRSIGLSRARAASVLFIGALATARTADADEPVTKDPPSPIVDADVQPVPAAPKTLTSWREAVALASAENVDYSVAVLEIDRQKGLARQTLAGALPTISASGSLTLNLIRQDAVTVDSDSFVATASTTIRQPLLAPRTWWAIGTAAEQVELAQINVEDKQRVLIAGLADAIVTVVTAERVAEVNRVGARAALERLRLQRRKRELGSGTDLDVLRFKQDVVSARSQIVQGDESLAQARERLGLALGAADGYSVDPAINIDEIESTLGRVCATGDLTDRADLRALKKQKDLSERAITDADLQYLPTADLVSTLSYTSATSILGDNHSSWSIQGVLTIPIFDGGARYGARRVAIASTRQAEERLDAATRAAKVEVTQASRAVEVATDARDIAAEARNLAAEVATIAQNAFNNGDGTSFDVVDAARRLREAELNLAIRELELVRAKIASMLATSTCKL
ncbi:MAG: TolC family protein [Polyangiaceae bacterium]